MELINRCNVELRGPNALFRLFTLDGGSGENRTPTSLRTLDFESSASTNSTTEPSMRTLILIYMDHGMESDELIKT